MKSINELSHERESIIGEYSAKNLKKYDIDTFSEENKKILNVIISEIKEETSDVKSFILVPNKEKKTFSLPTFKAGEYISVKLKIDDAYHARAYSLSSSPSESFYRITVKRVENGLVSNYMLDNLKVGDEIEISHPVGNFTYNKSRDEENVIAVAGGSGITPFISMAKAIESGLEDFKLTVFYSVKKEEDIIFKEEIKNLNKCKKINIFITLTREEKEGYLSGHLTKEMISPYIEEFNTIFMCGPKALYKTMNDILSEFNIPRRCVHFENFFVEYTPEKENTYKVKVVMNSGIKMIECKSNETLLVAMERSGIKAPSLCRVGECGFCRSILVEGKIKSIGGSNVKALEENNYFHPCISYPESDITLELNI